MKKIAQETILSDFSCYATKKKVDNHECKKKGSLSNPVDNE